VFLPIYATGFAENDKDVKDGEKFIIIAFLTSINITGYISK